MDQTTPLISSPVPVWQPVIRNPFEPGLANLNTETGNFLRCGLNNRLYSTSGSKPAPAVKKYLGDNNLEWQRVPHSTSVPRAMVVKLSYLWRNPFSDSFKAAIRGIPDVRHRTAIIATAQKYRVIMKTLRIWLQNNPFDPLVPIAEVCGLPAQDDNRTMAVFCCTEASLIADMLDFHQRPNVHDVILASKLDVCDVCTLSLALIQARGNFSVFATSFQRYKHATLWTQICYFGRSDDMQTKKLCRD